MKYMLGKNKLDENPLYTKVKHALIKNSMNKLIACVIYAKTIRGFYEENWIVLQIN